MSRNGSGTYNLPAGNPVVTGTTISSTWANSTLSDISTALTGSIASDGQTTPTANLPMGTYSHTNVGNATVRAMYASAGQVEDGTLNYLTAVTGTNAITAAAPVGMTAYVDGQVFRFVSAGANTGAVTINLNSIGAKSLVKTDGSALVSGDIASGAAVQIMYDGTNFQLLSDANGSSETVTTLTATTKVVTPQVGSSSGAFTIQSANTTAITVDASQNVGIGTTSPAFASSRNGLVVKGNTTNGGEIVVQTSVDTGSTGLAIAKYGVDSAITNRSNGILGFGTNDNERMRIDSSGNLLVGTTTEVLSATSNGFKVNGSKSIEQSAPSGNANIALFKPASASQSVFIFFSTNDSFIGNISQNGNSAVSYNTSSDYRLKEDVAPMIGALDTILQLKPVTYKWKADKSNGQGFIAHELAEIVPDCVTGEKDAVDIDGNPQYQGIDTSFLVATLTSAIQELKAIVDTQAEKIKTLETK